MSRPGKNQGLRPIDLPPPGVQGGALVVGVDIDPVAPPPAVVPQPPEGLQATTTLVVTPSGQYRSRITLTWFAPSASAGISHYAIRMRSVIGTEERRGRHDQALADRGQAQGAHLDDVREDTEYWISLAAVALGGNESAVSAWTPEVYVRTAKDTAGPGPVTDEAFTWDTADLRLVWTNPVDADTAGVYLTAEPAGGGLVWLETFVPGAPGQVVEYTIPYSLIFNRGGNRPTARVRLQPRDLAGNLATLSDTRTLDCINTPPGNVTGLTADFAGADCILDWSGVTNGGDLAGYRVTLTTAGPSPYTWPVPPDRTTFTLDFEENRKRHVFPPAYPNGIATPSVSFSIRAVDVFGQLSPTAATITAVNAPPPAPTALVSPWRTRPRTAPANLVASWSMAFPADFSHFAVTYEGKAQPRQTTATLTLTREQLIAGGGNYLAGFLAIVAVDVFGQTSTALTATMQNQQPPDMTADDLRLAGAGDKLDVRINSAARTADDFAAFVITLLQQEQAIDVVRTESTAKVLTLPRPGIYRVRVYAEDAYGQKTNTVESGVYVANFLSLAETRQDVTYRDSERRSSPELDVLKDGRGGATILY